MVTATKQTMLDIAFEKDGFKLGDPWRYSDDSLVAILPIIREVDGARGYTTLTEAEKVEVRDTGSIDRVHVRNGGDTYVFLCSGEILKGGTQERAFTMSQLVGAGEERDVDVVCTHQTRGIQRGERMKTGGYTPSRVLRRITAQPGRRAQAATWNSIREYHEVAISSARLADVSFAVEELRATPSDDLLKSMGTLSKVIRDMVNKIPRIDDQVGIALIDINGIKILECYDLWQSWKAVRDAVVNREGEDLSKLSKDASQVFQYRPERARGILKELLTKDFTENKIGGEGSWETLKLESNGYSGEVTLLQGSVVHLYLARKGGL